MIERAVEKAKDLRKWRRTIEANELMNEVPEREEIIKAMKEMRESAPGEDGVRIRYIQNACEDIEASEDRIVVAQSYTPSGLNIPLADCQLINLTGRILPPYNPLKFGSLPQITTDDHVVNSIIKDGLKLFLSSISCKEHTPTKYKNYIVNLASSGVISGLLSDAPKLGMLFKLFSEPKADPHNSRLIIDFKKLAKHLNPPNIKLPNIIKLMHSYRETDFMIKLDLMNGFFHISLHKSAMKEISLKCGKTYYQFNRLPQGLALAPYFMQRVMQALIKTFAKDLDVKFLIYLDFLFLGSEADLAIVVERLKASDFIFNLNKCILTPTKTLQYVGVNTNPSSKPVSLSEDFISNLHSEFKCVENRILTLRYKQRLAGLIKFARHIIQFPF